MKTAISMPDELANRLDDYCKKTGMKRSTTIQMAVSQYLDSQKMLESMPAFMSEMKKLMEENKNATDQ